MTARKKLRVGAVNYLNTKPLIHRFGEFAPEAELVLDLPSRLADDLAAGRLDVALVPSVECFSHPGYSVLSDACIGCRGPVLSVKLFFRVPVAEVRTLALDEGSRTSAALARILLAERYGVRPQTLDLPIGSTLADTTADAVLLIGDRAMHSPAGEFAAVWDLGDQWWQWTELPFVFALWIARPGLPADELARLDTALRGSRDAGVQALANIAAAEAAPLGLTQPECLGYLKHNLHFFLGQREQQALERFRRLAARAGLIPSGARLEFFARQCAG